FLNIQYHMSSLSPIPFFSLSYVEFQSTVTFFLEEKKTKQPLFDISEVSVGQHLYWQIGDFQVHAQVLITSWVVFTVIAVLAFLGNRNLQRTPDGLQNLTEYVTEFVRDLAKTQIGEEE